MVGQEVLDFDAEGVRRVERVLDHAAHPRAVGHAHVRAQRRAFVERHPEAVVALADAQHVDQLRHHAAVRVLDHHHRLLAGESGHVPVPLRLPVPRVLHLGDDQVDLRLQRVVLVEHVEEVPRHQHLAPLRRRVLPRVVGQLAEVAGDRLALEADVLPVERRLFLVLFEIVPLTLQPLAVVECREVDRPQRLRQVSLIELLQVLAKLLHALLAEAAAVLQRRQRQLRLVELDAVHPGVDLDPDHRLEVFAPDRVVAIHRVAGMLAVRALDPVRVARFPVDVPRDALVDQVGHRLAVAVDQPAGKVVLHRWPELRVPVL